MHFPREPLRNPPISNSRFSRPQTPQPHSSYSPNRYPPNMAYRPMPIPPPQHRYPNLSRSRISNNSSASSGLNFLNQADQNQMFPQDLIFLLRNQDRNINNFKQKIQREKAKVENDFQVWKDEIQHIIQDLKISVQAQLDLVYKTFITKYAEIKTEVQQLRKTRKEILLQNGANLGPKFGANNPSSNKDIIQEIEKDAQQYRSYKIYGYLSELIKQKLEPILQLSTELILIGSAQCPFYRNKQMNEALKDLKQLYTTELGKIYHRLGDYILTPQAIIDKENIIQDNWQHNVLRNLDHPQQIKFTPQSHQPPPSPMRPLVRVSPNQQSLATKFCQNITLNRLETINTDHNDSILCIFFIADKFIATGSKDRTINIYTLDGRKVTSLRGHDASICCLSSIMNLNRVTYLASGSDHGCSCLIIWDIRTWKMYQRIQAHSAAVTSILDLADGRHLVTGSYDKKINLYDFTKGQLVSTLDKNKTSVTGIVMSADRNRMIASGLDNGLSIWYISRRDNIVESITLQKVIMNNTLVCSLNSLQLRAQYVLGATRDGKLKLFNIMSGQIEKAYTVNENSIIQLVLIERQMKSDSPIALTCSSKDKTLIQTKTQSGSSSFVNLENPIGVEFGCGIGPKVVMSSYRNGLMAIANQGAFKKQFSLYEIVLKQGYK